MINNTYILYITDATDKKVREFYSALEDRGFSVSSLKVAVPGCQYGFIHSPTYRRETIKEGRLIVLETPDSIGRLLLSGLIDRILTANRTHVLGYEATLEHRTVATRRQKIRSRRSK